MSDIRHLPSRRGFIAAASFGVVSLYGLWAVLGAAPFGFSAGDHGDAGHDGEPVPGGTDAGHGGHAAAAGGPSATEFRTAVEEFIARNRLPDGSVRPRANGEDAHHGHGAATPMAPATGPVDVYLLAQQWSLEPDRLLLSADTPYRFRMMAVDTSHGASIHMGLASRMMRLRRGVLVETDLTFTRPGEYLAYCTVYCGAGHDRMVAKMIVT